MQILSSTEFKTALYNFCPTLERYFNGSAALARSPAGIILLKRRQPDKHAAAANKFCSFFTSNGVYTEFGINLDRDKEFLTIYLLRYLPN